MPQADGLDKQVQGEGECFQDPFCSSPPQDLPRVRGYAEEEAWNRVGRENLSYKGGREKNKRVLDLCLFCVML